VKTQGAVVGGFPYIYRGTLDAIASKVASWWGEGNSNGNGSAASDFHIDVLVQARKAGVSLNGGNIVCFNRRFGNTYAHTEANLLGGGVVTLSLATEVDTNITLTSAEAEELVDGTTATVVPAFGSFTADINDDDGDEDYTLRVDGDSQVSPDIYQALMFLAQDETRTLNGIPGDAYTSANPGSFTPNVKFPFGALAAGTLVYAQGGYPINSGDANYQSTDNSGSTYSPPTSITVGFASGLLAGDKVTALPIAVIGGPVIKNEYAIAAAADGGNTVQVGSAIAKDKPSSNFLIIVESATGHEYLFRYVSRDTDTFTLPAGLPANTASDASTGKVLTDSAATFLAAGVQFGDFIYNVDDGSWGNVKSVDSETQISMTKLFGGTNNDWKIGDNYEIGILPKTFTVSDFVYVPYAMGIATGPSFTKSVQLVDANRLVRFIARRSSVGDGAAAMKRVQQDAVIGTVPVGRNPETLASL
jgi:hypothetical protein